MGEVDRRSGPAPVNAERGPTQHLINRCCGSIDQTVGTVTTPANCVTCAPFINHTATLPFAQWEHRRGPTVEEGKSPRILAITLDQVERPA
ncbi:MAG TPA: hypothetical protein VNN81_17025 [Bradyrhizobium sp.]|jgi:hypothetical protein|nr:hypothetical protein [Bradyrhizobium sp.]